MSSNSKIEFWDLWYPKAAATGVQFARGRLDSTQILLVHAAPPVLTVEVRDENGARLAMGVDLPQTADRPIARLTRHGNEITREDLWPSVEDIGSLVILPGGEVGELIEWWNAEDGSEWRWRVEFYNHI
jgi:hypothetical protein